MSMEQELISIIVPVYNTKEYLPKCVQSLVEQTYRNLEILLVDDGSTDETGALCDKLALTDDRIRVIHKENGGSSSARNVGISQAAGSFLGFVDSDDYVDADMYERLYGAILAFGVNIAQVGRDEITPEGEVMPDICKPADETEVISAAHFMEELLMHRGDCSFCTKLIRRNLFFEGGIEHAAEHNAFPVGVLNEDFHLLLYMLLRSGPVVSLPGHTYHVVYRVGSNSRKASANEFSRVFADNVDNADLAAKLVEEHYPELSEVVFRFGIFQRIDYMLHIPISQMRRDHETYRAIVTYLRRNWLRSMKNPVLTTKNKLYHTLFAVCPKGIRRLHRLIRKLR